jgi:hypothetical protein
VRPREVHLGGERRDEPRVAAHGYEPTRVTLLREFLVERYGEMVQRRTRERARRGATPRGRR